MGFEFISVIVSLESMRSLFAIWQTMEVQVRIKTVEIIKAFLLH